MKNTHTTENLNNYKNESESLGHNTIILVWQNTTYYRQRNNNKMFSLNAAFTTIYIDRAG